MTLRNRLKIEEMIKAIKRSRIQRAIKYHQQKQWIMDHNHYIMGIDEIKHKADCEGRYISRLTKLLNKYR